MAVISRSPRPPQAKHFNCAGWLTPISWSAQSCIPGLRRQLGIADRRARTARSLTIFTAAAAAHSAGSGYGSKLHHALATEPVTPTSTRIGPAEFRSSTSISPSHPTNPRAAPDRRTTRVSAVRLRCTEGRGSRADRLRLAAANAGTRIVQRKSLKSSPNGAITPRPEPDCHIGTYRWCRKRCLKLLSSSSCRFWSPHGSEHYPRPGARATQGRCKKPSRPGKALGLARC